MNATISVSAGEIREFYHSAIRKLDFDPDRARTLSEIFLASLDHHALSVLFDRVTSGAIDPKALPSLVKKRRRAVMIDGSGTEPHLTLLLAAETACETAAAEGVALTCLCGLLPVGRLRIYEKVAAAHGLIGSAKEAVYEAGTDKKMTHSFLAVDPGHFGDRDRTTSLMIEFAQHTGNPNARAPRAIDPGFENEGTSRTYTGVLTAVYKNRDLIEVPVSVIPLWNEIAAALEMKEPFPPG